MQCERCFGSGRVTTCADMASLDAGAVLAEASALLCVITATPRLHPMSCRPSRAGVGEPKTWLAWRLCGDRRSLRCASPHPQRCAPKSSAPPCNDPSPLQTLFKQGLDQGLCLAQMRHSRRPARCCAA